MRAAALALLSALLGTACASGSAVGELRYHNQPPVTRVNDREDVPRKPEDPGFVITLYMFDGFFHKRLTRLMEVREHLRALNVNSMGEVPDSTWFTNRIGVRDMTPREVARGPNKTGSPEEHRPWTILSTKVGGAAVGFIIKDARGERFLLKFDQKGFPEVETATDVIVQRILWAAGYNVPEDYVVEFSREDLVIGEGAVVKRVFGGDDPLTESFLDEQLEKVIVRRDGTIRGLASRFVPGVPIGGAPGEGVRADDPNDLVPHQHRRDLRGQYALFSWLDHTDIKQDNTLDVWSEDPADPRRHYVVHYLIDFGKALGTQAFIAGDRSAGHANNFDFAAMALSTATLGLWVRPWESRRHTGLRGVGLYEAEPYDPGSWHPRVPSYYPIEVADRFDNFWASKILIRFTREQLRAIVKEARLSDPRAEDYLVKTLIERQRATARYWFARVSPLDSFELREHPDGSYELCFEDLAQKYELRGAPGEESSYRADAFDWSGASIGWQRETSAGPKGRACLSGIRPGQQRAGYTIVRIETTRGHMDLPGTLVHLAEDPATGVLRIIGLRRQ